MTKGVVTKIKTVKPVKNGTLKSKKHDVENLLLFFYLFN